MKRGDTVVAADATAVPLEVALEEVVAAAGGNLLERLVGS